MFITCGACVPVTTKTSLCFTVTFPMLTGDTSTQQILTPR